MKNKLFSPARKEAGFTLIELLTVIVIIGILAAIAIPIFTSQRARAQDSQTVSDVRNAAIAAESFLADKNNKFSDLSKTNIEFASSKNVSWDIKGNDSIGGYCIVAKNAAGKKYATDATALTYDSLAGGVGKSGVACTSANTPTPSGSTAVGSDVSISAPAPTNVAANRNSETSATVTWTPSTDTNVTGYLVQRATTNADASFTTVGTIASRTTGSFTDTSAPGTEAYYRLVSTTAAGTSTLKSTVATLGAYVASTTFSTNGSNRTGSIQTYTVATTGVYKIEVYGAAGGSGVDVQNANRPRYNGGQGAVKVATATLTAGKTLSILVGQAGTDANDTSAPNGYTNGGGGGGSYVVDNTTPLVIAGGGGGGNGYQRVPGQSASVTQNDSSGNSNVGQGGYTSQGSYAAPGAGWFSDGNQNSYGGAALRFLANGSGGSSSFGFHGGYGGGSVPGYLSAGAGGGYTGGSSLYAGYAYGGGSYVASNFTSVSDGYNPNPDGKVIITKIS